MRIKIQAAALIIVVVLISQSNAQTSKREFVPDQATAIAIARAVLIPIYGKAQIASEEPLKATRYGPKWHIDGTLSCASKCFGGTAFVAIAASDGRIISVFHMQ